MQYNFALCDRVFVVRDIDTSPDTSLKKQLNDLERSVRLAEYDTSETTLKSNLESSKAMKDALEQVKQSELYCILQPKLMDEEFWSLMDNLEKIDHSDIEVAGTYTCTLVMHSCYL